MRSIRVIPCLDIKDNRVVKGVNFVGLRDAGDPVELAAFYDSEGADELVFLDITASSDGRAPVIALAEKVAERVFIPFTVGGGLRRVEDVRGALLAGADKVSLNSAALARPELVRECAEQFGAQCVVIAVDCRKVPNQQRWTVYSHGGRTDTGRDLVEWVQQAESLGAGEVLLTSMDGDGTLAGYDLAPTRAVADSVRIPVIASGGAGRPEHLVSAVREGGADAVLLASILHDGTFRMDDLKAHMQAEGLPVRRLRRELV